MVKERAGCRTACYSDPEQDSDLFQKNASMQGLAKHFVVAKSVISDQAAYGNLRGLESGEFPPYSNNG